MRDAIHQAIDGTRDTLRQGRLEGFIHLKRGFDITAAEQREGTVPVVSSSGITSYHDSAMVKGPGVVIGRKGKLGDAYYIDRDFWPHDTTLWVTDFKKNDPKFIAYFLRWLRLERLDAATSVPTLNRNFVHPLPVAMPEPAEQRRIAEILDSADDQIGATEVALRKLTSLKSGVIRAAFDGMPQGRERSTVGALFPIKSGITLGPHRLPDEKASKYLRVANVQRALIDLSDVALIQASATEKAELELAIGDLLVVEGHANPDEIGRCALVGSDAAGLLYQNHLFRLRSAKVDPEFAELWLNSDETRAYWRRMTATSSGLYTINSRMLRELPFPAVAPEDQADVVNAQRLVANTIKVLHEELDKLRLIKLGLMDELLTGRMRMPTLYLGMEFTVGRCRRGGPPLRNVRLRLYRRNATCCQMHRSLRHA
jgi:restriction endonuclease S subunit